jgi:prepilin-type N-terminal cleavage/methylation domain-containing protein
MKTRGFTIVELLIVIVVIAILATISIVAYNGIQARGRASEASYGLAQAKKKLELYKVDNGAYPTTGNLASAGVTDGDVSYQYTSSGTTYCITGTAGTVSYKASDSTNPTAGGCSGHGVGGTSPITNLAVNPSVESGLATIYGITSATTVRETNVSATAGSYVVKVTTPGAVSNEGVGTSIGAQPFGTYTGSVYLWGSGTVRVWLRFGFTDATYLESTYLGPVTITSTPQRFSVTGTFANNGKTPSYLELYVRTSTVQATTFYADSMMVTPGSNLYGYADGNTTDWVWNGTANASTSTGPPQ